MAVVAQIITDALQVIYVIMSKFVSLPVRQAAAIDYTGMVLTIYQSNIAFADQTGNNTQICLETILKDQYFLFFHKFCQSVFEFHMQIECTI